MAKLDAIRDTIVPYYERDTAPTIVVEGAVDEDVSADDDAEIATFDDEDFWESVDLLETCHKILKQLTKRYKLPRRVEHHMHDIKQFIDQWPLAEAAIGGDDE